MDKKEILKILDSQKDEIVQLCSQLLKINSENPPGDSTEVSNFVINYLNNNGIQTDVYETDKNRFNIVATIGGDDECGCLTQKELIYCGHSDTVPVGNLEGWSFDPFSGEVVDGILRGRGASDMKAGLGGLMYSLVFLKKQGIKLNGKLTLAVVPDEETGSEFGVPLLLNKGIIKGDACLIAEPSGRLNPTIGQKGSGSFKLRVKGIPGHASLSPLLGKNAITEAVKCINLVEKITSEKVVIPQELRELIDISKKYVSESERSKGAEIFERVSFNVGTIVGGSALNVVADICEVSFDCRLPFGVDRDEFLKKIIAGLDELNVDYEMQELGVKSSANYTPAEHPICKAVVDNISYVTQENAYGVLQWACSDARYFREHNIAVLQYGPAILSTIHGYDERVEVDNIIECAKVYVLAAIEYLNGVENE